MASRWSKWISNLNCLAQLKVDRYFLDFREADQIQLHVFCDASQEGYGVVAYLRICKSGNIWTKFVIGKSRLAPIKSISVPRLELEAETLAAKLNYAILRELRRTDMTSTFWTDSTTVLHLIHNSSKRFPTFVANRLAKIDETSNPKQWRYVPSKLNPADDATRGLDASNIINKSRWINGPDFLRYDEESWPVAPCVLPVIPEEFEVLKRDISVNATKTLKVPESITERFSRFSSWYKLKRAVAWILKLKEILRKRVTSKTPLTTDEIESAEIVIIQCVQRDHFRSEIDRLQKKERIGKNVLTRLNPVLFEGVLRVGGRLKHANISFASKHPIVLPNHSHVTTLVIQDYHERVGHSGMSHTWANIRQKYWIIKGAAAVRNVLGQCLLCKRRNAKAGQQMMSDLPKSRLAVNKPPFYFTGVDYFGPLFVKQGRAMVKRWGCLFTCMTVRAVHIELVTSLSADSFINALRRFIGRRGKPYEITSDNGTNFVAADKELRLSIQNLNNVTVENYLKQRSIRWKFNCPYASHMGGVWERQIRSVRRILNALTTNQTLTDEGLTTLLIEVEAILNSRPLTPVNMDPEDNVPLTPNHLLLLGEMPNSAPGIFTKDDQYSKKRWRQIQYLADQFWFRWGREYLQLLQVRPKWQTSEDNYNIDDIVLVHDENAPRGKWPLGKVVDIFPDRNNRVRQVLVKTATSTFRRPISKLYKILNAK